MSALVQLLLGLASSRLPHPGLVSTQPWGPKEVTGRGKGWFSGPNPDYAFSLTLNFNATSYVKSLFRTEQTGRKACLGLLSFSGTSSS